MRNCIVKEEEQNVQTPVSTSKTEPYNLNKRKDKEENQSFQQAYLKAVSKFLQALHILQLAQHRSQNLGIPSYPFVLQYQYNEFLVHLGGHKIDVANTPDRNDCQEQLHMQQFVPRLNTQQCVSIKLGIHKRKGMLNQEQKDTKNIPKNYCKAIITFASKNPALCHQILGDQLKVVKFLERITVYKRKLMNIRTFSGLLSQSEDPHEEEFNQTFRILSRIFVKKYAINYIFNSKIVQHNWHLRYRQQIYKGIKNPKNFSHIKKL
ncbi:unnamed protein product (macronuclear) [Paramecium tetraurelia]|uniref:Uncharacterized protein n=1 Tax=Paramecium tetraurelia TaxID=5888 RepID=A0DWK8_PARTE|nr:uncharacterized protein GSPATT00021068001 [Paramecium tetraurelia]CAK87425.1 unnamed protein product [Paramecium tetraurelia]|eukprot:XP_001454822.1 hypothetical protein (macronuclear) [Paramecium tetraurelia strain d4-2]